MTRDESCEFVFSGWRLQLPVQWEIDDQADPLMVLTETGALQFSEAEKEGVPITMQEVRDFAVDEMGSAEDLRPFSTAESGVQGIEVRYQEDSVHWAKWWLYSGLHLLFITYNSEDEVPDAVGRVVDSVSFVGSD